MSSVQLADILWTRLKQDHVWEHREVVFLAHSLGGILVEEMLLRHPAEAAKVKFIVSYGTPHEGSTIARIASIYDKDPLLNDLSDASDNLKLLVEIARRARDVDAAGMPRSRSFTRLTMRVGLLHLGQSVDFVVSITFLRSPVFAILAIGRVFLLLGLSLHTRARICARLQRRGHGPSLGNRKKIAL
jgi:pimeloyl-ACP methyl ester carboxylesterase